MRVSFLDSEAVILTNDKAIRKKCKKLDYNFHGLLWVFDEFVCQRRTFR